jgi:LysM repeat protein
MRDHGIEQVRLVTKGYGEDKLLVANPQTEEELAINRRTEFIVRRVDLNAQTAQQLPNTRALYQPRLEPQVARAPQVIIQDVDKRGLPVRPPTSTAMDASAEATDGVYTVRPGDTLFSLARRFNTSVAKLQELNQLSGDRIQADQKLRVR